MSVFFQNLAAAAHNAIHAYYMSLFSLALGTNADELADWYKLDPTELELDDGVEVYAKRITLPIWDLVSPDHAAEVASDLMLEFEAKHNLFVCSYTGDSEFVVYITNVECELDNLRIAFEDVEEIEEEEEELEEDVRTSESGRVLSIVPQIGNQQPAAPVSASVVVDADFPPEEDFPEEPEQAAPVTAQTPAVELADADLVEEEPLPEEEPVNEAQAAPVATETEAQGNAVADALNGQPLYAQEPLTTDETLAVIADRRDQQPEAEPATDNAQAEAIAEADQGPVKESAEIIAVIHAEKMQQIIGMLPSDTMHEIDDQTGVLTLMYSREVNGENVDYVRTIRIENENFQNIRYVDVFYVEDEAGVVLNRTSNATIVVRQLDNLIV
jgi:hypothetical protein